jgi:AcrR family transcriptional regulator
VSGHGDAPRQRILAAAGEELARVGHRRLTVVAVAAAAGMAHPNVYRYFTSKAALIDALTAAWLKPLEQQLAAVADGPDPAVDKLERLILALHRGYRQRLGAEPQLFEAFVMAFEGNRGVARQHRTRVRALLDRAVEEGVSANAFGLRDRNRALTLVLDATYRFLHPGLIVADLRAEQDRHADERLARVIDAVIAALQRGASSRR